MRPLLCCDNARILSQCTLHTHLIQSLGLLMLRSTVHVVDPLRLVNNGCQTELEFRGSSVTDGDTRTSPASCQSENADAQLQRRELAVAPGNACFLLVCWTYLLLLSSASREEAPHAPVSVLCARARPQWCPASTALC